MILLDTHVWAWSLAGRDRLSPRAADALETAPTFYVSPISFFEIGQKVRLGKWPDMEPHVDQLPEYLTQQGGVVAPFTADISLKAAMLDWDHRDPFDRILLATAAVLSVPLITKDAVFEPRSDITTIW